MGLFALSHGIEFESDQCARLRSADHRHDAIKKRLSVQAAPIFRATENWIQHRIRSPGGVQIPCAQVFCFCFRFRNRRPHQPRDAPPLSDRPHPTAHAATSARTTARRSSRSPETCCKTGKPSKPPRRRVGRASACRDGRPIGARPSPGENSGAIPTYARVPRQRLVASPRAARIRRSTARIDPRPAR
jgi:hypothetical protein